MISIKLGAQCHFDVELNFSNVWNGFSISQWKQLIFEFIIYSETNNFELIHTFLD